MRAVPTTLWVMMWTPLIMAAKTTTRKSTTSVFQQPSPSIKTIGETSTTILDANNASISTDSRRSKLSPTSALSPIPIALPDPPPPPPPRTSQNTSSLPLPLPIAPTTSLRSPSLFPPNGLANRTSCQCAASAVRGIYCGSCSQIKPCAYGSNCWASMFSCGEGCVDYGWSAHCAQAARDAAGEVNCPIVW